MAEELRIGIGNDTHRLAPGLPLWIGGVEIPGPRGAVAHSDGDVLLHALVDALLGAVALGDIGELFPDDDPAHAGRASAEMVAEALSRLRAAGGRVVNLDAVVELEQPRILPHRHTIRESLSRRTGLDLDRISVKGKSGEGVGPVGRGEAIAARVAVLVARAPHE